MVGQLTLLEMNEDIGWLVGHRWPEENLTVMKDVKDAYGSGYSVGLHEFAHTVRSKALTAEQAKKVTELYAARKKAGGPWTEAYGASNETEYFAQCTNAYFGKNERVGHNGRDWLLKNDSDMCKFLDALYTKEFEEQRSDEIDAWTTEPRSRGSISGVAQTAAISTQRSCPSYVTQTRSCTPAGRGYRAVNAENCVGAQMVRLSGDELVLEIRRSRPDPQHCCTASWTEPGDPSLSVRGRPKCRARRPSSHFAREVSES
jgi:hypothetical protein